MPIATVTSSPSAALIVAVIVIVPSEFSAIELAEVDSVIVGDKLSSSTIVTEISCVLFSNAGPPILPIPVP